MKRAGVLAAYAGLAALQCAVAVAYLSRGTWWHYLLHQQVGWGLGLAAAATWMALRAGSYVPPIGAAVGGQLVSIVPDLMFRYLRMPHEPSMDLWLGHVSIHRGPSPVLVALAVLLLGGTAWLAAARGWRSPALGAAAAAAAVLTVACLLAEQIPRRLADF